MIKAQSSLFHNHMPHNPVKISKLITTSGAKIGDPLNLITLTAKIRGMLRLLLL